MGALEVNKIIVESHNDKYFIQRILEKLELIDIEISEPICNIDEFICLDGMGNLEKKLRDIKLDELDKLGIVIDADEVGIEKRIDEINNIFQKVGIHIKFENINEFKKDIKNNIEISCHILHTNGSGDLDTILKKIATGDSPFADCLDAWRMCLKEKNEDVADKVFLKFWVNNYLKFDTCTKEEQKQSFKKCNFEKALVKDVWDFENPALDSLKDFLKLFNKKEK